MGDEGVLGLVESRLRIIYISVGCPRSVVDELIRSGKPLPLQALRFHHLLVSGLAAQAAVETVDAIALPPVRAGGSGKCNAQDFGQADRVHYHYLQLPETTFLRQLSIFMQTASIMSAVCSTNHDRSGIYVLTDGLNLSASLAAKAISFLYGVRCVAIVTDVPLSMHRMAHPHFRFRALGSLAINLLRAKALLLFDGYIFLTRQMDHVINRRNRTSIVIEGFVDAQSSPASPRGGAVDHRLVVMYAGGIDRVNGVDRLIQAFEGIPDKHLQLWLFGEGELSGWAAGEAQKDPRIQFRGRVPNDEVLRAEAEADLLVNPRPTGDEYTRFSFPSKNLEYMASGTPLLTTRLAGIPDDHFPHLYIIDDDSVEGIRSALREVLGRSPAERARKAAAAREYALKEKSNVRAAGRLIAFLETMVGRRRKLLFIAPLPPPAFGQSIAASRLLAALGGTEECAVVDYNRRRIGSSVVGFSRVRDALRYVLRVKRMARRASTTYLTLSQSVAGNLRDLVTMALCGRTRLIVHLHGGSLRRAIFDRWSVLRALNRLAYRRVDTVIVLGRSLRHIFDGMVESRRIEVVANFASEAAFAAEEEIEAKFIGGPIRMVFLSNMIHGKGYGEAASALVSLAGEIDFQAEFIGQFESRDAHRRFMELIDPHPSIRYLGALGEERFERLRRSHLFLLPSYYVHEGQPISILEAYAAGNFVITTEQGGIRDIFRHEVNGFLVEQRSVRDIADKIRQYSRLCREERLAYARRNRSYALAAFREEVHLTALIAILRGKARTRRESEAIPSDFL